jgi:GntR family transcriptional repressor for pyruvate dehydrogenase complex
MIRPVSQPQLHIEPAGRQKLAQIVAHRLLELIESGTLQEGDRLPSESELKERFAVGRSTIREALNGLVLLGAVEVRHGQGAVVVGPPRADSGLEAALRTARDADLIEVRRALETAIAEAAAVRGTDDDLAEVRALLDEAERHLAEEGSAVVESVGFHLRLAEATGNPFFIRFIEFSGELMSERGERLRSARGYANWELRMHRRLYEAIASRDPERARAEMESHLEDAREIILHGWDAFRAQHDLT